LERRETAAKTNDNYTIFAADFNLRVTHPEPLSPHQVALAELPSRFSTQTNKLSFYLSLRPSEGNTAPIDLYAGFTNVDGNPAAARYLSPPKATSGAK